MDRKLRLAILIITACCGFEAAPTASSAAPIEQRQSQDKTDTSSLDLQPQSVRFPSNDLMPYVIFCHYYPFFITETS